MDIATIIGLLSGAGLILSAILMGGIDGVERVEKDVTATGHFLVEYRPGHAVREAIARAAVEGDWGLIELRPSQRSLEEIFLKLTSDDSQQDT